MMEELSKSNVVLLALLVSFVTAIAAGAITVSLSDMKGGQPASVGSVEAVEAAPAGSGAHSDALAGAVARVLPSVVRLYGEDGTLVGLGVVISPTGTVLTDTSALGNATSVAMTLPNGVRASASVSTHDSAHGLVYLTPGESDATSTVFWNPIRIAAAVPQLGTESVVLGGVHTNRVEPGYVTALLPGSGDTPLVIETNIARDAILSGSPLVDVSGELVGISTDVSRTAVDGGFIPASVVMGDTQ